MPRSVFVDWQTEYVRADMEIHRLKTWLDQALEALQAVEWVSRVGSGGMFCPWCKGLYPDHKADCQRQAALAKAEEG